MTNFLRVRTTFNLLLSTFNLLLLAACCNVLQATATDFSFKEVNDATGLELTENGKPVYVYNYGMLLATNAPKGMRRSCYLHPVYGPDGATVLTDDFNPDHWHHRGIFWAWEVVAVDGKTNDVWTVKGFHQKFVKWLERETTPEIARLSFENGWYDGDHKFVNEQVEVVTHPAAKGQRIMDFTLKFEATDHPVMIVGTPDEHKGYGGFAFRTATRDGGAAKTIIRTDKGVLEKDGVMSRHAWAEIDATFKGVDAGVRIEDAPSNPGYPNNGWLLRHGFALMNVSYPGHDPLYLEHGKPLVLKYRVILFLGKTLLTQP